MTSASASASAAPPTRLRISRKALTEFRVLAVEYDELGDSELAALIDDKIAALQPLHRVTDGKHPEDLTSVYEIHHGDAKRYAIVRDGCCVTLLVEAIVNRNLSSGNWWIGARTLGTPPIVSPVAPAVPPIVKAKVAKSPKPKVASLELAVTEPLAPMAPVADPATSPAPPREEIVSPIPLPLAAQGVAMVEAHIAVARARLALVPIVERVAAARAELAAALVAQGAAERVLNDAIDHYMTMHDAMEQAVEAAIAAGQDR